MEVPSGPIADKYYTVGGSKGSLGNPATAAEALAGGGRWQRFERGAILAPPQGIYALHGPVWDRFQTEGGVAKLGLPRRDVYSYFVGPAAEWQAELALVVVNRGFCTPPLPRVTMWHQPVLRAGR